MSTEELEQRLADLKENQHTLYDAISDLRKKLDEIAIQIDILLRLPK